MNIRERGILDVFPVFVYNCYIVCITTKDGENMIITIDFESSEAIYVQLRNQIIVGIAANHIREGDSLPSVRQLAENIGINMHTVNKAYSVLCREGFVKLDQRKGAVIALDFDKMQAVAELRRDLRVLLAWGICKNIDRMGVHRLVDDIYDQYADGCKE